MRPRTMLLATLLLAPLGALPQDTVAPDADAIADTLRAPPPEVKAANLAATGDAAPAAAPASRKHGFFPIWGDKVRAKGFDLPEPFGVMTNYYWQKSDVKISKLKLGLNGGPLVDAGFIQIPSAQTKAGALCVRPSLMIFPFLSVYGVFSSGDTETNVHITEPVAYDTIAKSGAQVLALGATFQMGYKGVFAVADFNGAVSDVDRLADTVGSNMLSFRLGYNFKLDAHGRGVAVWAGTAGQVLGVDTKGSVRLGDVIAPPSQATIDQAQARCDAMRPGSGQGLCNQLVQKLASFDPNTTVEYSLEKRPAGVWNMVLGAQYALDRSWQFRVESTFLNGRTSFLGGVEYRFDIL